MSSIIKVEIEKENFYDLTNTEMVDFIHEIYKQNLIKEAGVEEDWFDEETKHADYYVSSTFFNLGFKLLGNVPDWLYSAINLEKVPFLRLWNVERTADPRLFNVHVLNKQDQLIAQFYFYTEFDSEFGRFEIDKDFQYRVKNHMELVANGEAYLEGHLHND